MSLSPDYVRLVLNDNFEDAKRLFLEPLMAIHYAHLIMLTEQGIVGREDAWRIRAALDGIPLDEVRRSVYDGSCEDLFFHVERLIVADCGADVAGHLHTARSRNDIDMVLYRMRLRVNLLDVLDATHAVRSALLDLAEAGVETIFPAHTHTQPAQPTTVAHYLLAVVEQLERDAVRLSAAFDSTNLCPLGACAITGTGFGISRQRTSDLLGFRAPTGNTYGSIATVDYVLEGAAATATSLAGLGRFVQDMLLWCTREFGYLRLDDSLVQSSSIMPQKRNPVALEHARSLLSKALAQAVAVPTAVHNTPFGDIVDTEDDLQPLLATLYADAARGIALVAVAMAGGTFDAARMRQRAGEGLVTITELADSLARDHGLAFRVAHHIATKLVAASGCDASRITAAALAAASREVTGRPIELSDETIERLLSPEHFVAVRRTLGGPAPEVVRAALGVSRAALAADHGASTGRRTALAAADRARRDAVDAI